MTNGQRIDAYPTAASAAGLLTDEAAARTHYGSVIEQYRGCGFVVGVFMLGPDGLQHAETCGGCWKPVHAETGACACDGELYAAVAGGAE